VDQDVNRSCEHRRCGINHAGPSGLGIISSAIIPTLTGGAIKWRSFGPVNGGPADLNGYSFFTGAAFEPLTRSMSARHSCSED
jgi:hypothetical protein